MLENLVNQKKKLIGVLKNLNLKVFVETNLRYLDSTKKSLYKRKYSVALKFKPRAIRCTLYIFISSDLTLIVPV